MTKKTEKKRTRGVDRCSKTGLPRDPEECIKCSSFRYFFKGRPVCFLAYPGGNGWNDTKVESSTFTVSPHHAMVMAFSGAESKSPVDEMRSKDVADKVRETLRTLTEREQRVMSLRFGLDNGYPMTLDEVGKRFNITRERARQIEKKALRKLRHPCRVKVLSELV
jgi:RNA polymerase sigma factor (sigma-70 family)